MLDTDPSFAWFSLSSYSTCSRSRAVIAVSVEKPVEQKMFGYSGPTALRGALLSQVISNFPSEIGLTQKQM